jgi:hypothetical protein
VRKQQWGKWALVSACLDKSRPGSAGYHVSTACRTCRPAGRTACLSGRASLPEGVTQSGRVTQTEETVYTGVAATGIVQLDLGSSWASSRVGRGRLWSIQRRLSTVTPQTLPDGDGPNYLRQHRQAYCRFLSFLRTGAWRSTFHPRLMLRCVSCGHSRQIGVFCFGAARTVPLCCRRTDGYWHLDSYKAAWNRQAVGYHVQKHKPGEGKKMTESVTRGLNRD